MRHFFSKDQATAQIYTLSLHDALPISHQDFRSPSRCAAAAASAVVPKSAKQVAPDPDMRASLMAGRRCSASKTSATDRKSTRLNSSHPSISYAVFCLKKKKKHHLPQKN